MRCRLKNALGAGLVLGLGAAAARAEPATPEGAKAIAAVYAAYFSQSLIDKGVIEVTPEGEDYVVAWDLQKAVAAAGGASSVLKVAPFVYRVTPTLDGGWIAKSSSLPSLTFGPTGENTREGGAVGFEGFHFDSLFDPAAADFWRGKLALSALKFDVKAKNEADLQHIVLTENAIGGEVKVKASQDPGGVDVRMSQTIDSARQVVGAVGEGDDPAETPVGEFRQGATASDGEIAGLRAKAIGDLWRLVVAHIDSAPASPEELKPKLEALLPLWRQLAGRVGLDDIAVVFPGGGVTIKSVGQEVKLTGLVEQASADLFLAIKDMTVDLEAAPEWTKSVWPASLQVRITGGVDGLARATRLVLDDPEMMKSGDLGQETKDAIQHLLVEGHPHLSIGATSLSTPLVEATFEGEADFAAEGPRAHAKVTANDLDKLMQLLAKIGESEPDAQQGLLVATFVKGLARQEDGRLVWDIEFVAPNAIKVNGQTFSSPTP